MQAVTEHHSGHRKHKGAGAVSNDMEYLEISSAGSISGYYIITYYL